MAGKPSAVLLLGPYEPWCDKALLHACALLEVVQVQRHQRTDKHLDPVSDADWLLNFLSAPKVPSDVLARFGLRAINFHPAPPEYPGVGSASLALYDKRKTHGATAHVMDEQFDHGTVLRVRRFRIDPAWGYRALFDHSLAETFELFLEVLSDISSGVPRSPSLIGWQRKAITRREFEHHPAFTEVAA